MSLLAQQVAGLIVVSRPPNPGADASRRAGEAKKDAIAALIARHGPIGETEIASRSGLSRTNVHNHLMDMERARRIVRASDQPRAPWVIANPIPARLVTFETKEDLE